MNLKKVADEKSQKEKVQEWMRAVFKETSRISHKSSYKDGTVRYDAMGNPHAVMFNVGAKQNELVEKAEKLGLKLEKASFGSALFKVNSNWFVPAPSVK